MISLVDKVLSIPCSPSDKRVLKLLNIHGNPGTLLRGTSFKLRMTLEFGSTFLPERTHGSRRRYQSFSYNLPRTTLASSTDGGRTSANVDVGLMGREILKHYNNGRVRYWSPTQTGNKWKQEFDGPYIKVPRESIEEPSFI